MGRGNAFPVTERKFPIEAFTCTFPVYLHWRFAVRFLPFYMHIDTNLIIPLTVLRNCMHTQLNLSHHTIWTPFKLWPIWCSESSSKRRSKKSHKARRGEHFPLKPSLGYFLSICSCISLCHCQFSFQVLLSLFAIFFCGGNLIASSFVPLTLHFCLFFT